MTECQRVEVGPNVLRKYIEFLALAEPYRGTLFHEFCKEERHVESPTLTRAFDRAAAELAVRHIIDSANQTSAPKLDFRVSSASMDLVRESKVNLSPRQYTASIKALSLAEGELSLIDANRSPPLEEGATFPWKAGEDPKTGHRCWHNVNTNFTSFKRPRCRWEYKLDFLARLRPKFHTTRSDAQRLCGDSAERPGTTFKRWGWSEDDSDTRHRKHGQKKIQQCLEDQDARRLVTPSHVEAVARTLVQIIAHVENCLKMERGCQGRDTRKFARSCRHPAVGYSHMKHISSSMMCGGNCIDLKYIHALCSDSGSVVPYTEDNTEKNEKSPCLDCELGAGSDFLPLEPCSGGKKVSRLFMSTLNLTCAVALHLGLSGQGTKKDLQSDVVRRNTVDFNDKKKSAGTYSNNKHGLLRHANGRSGFETLLIHDIVKTSVIPKSRVVIDEIVIVRRDPAHTNGTKSQAFASRSTSKSNKNMHFAIRAQHGGKMRRQNRKNRTSLGWTTDHKNLIIAKLTFVGTSKSGVYTSASAVAAAARDESSPLRRLGAVSCCCIDGTACAALELRQQAWPSYWAFFMSPLYFGYRTGWPSSTHNPSIRAEVHRHGHSSRHVQYSVSAGASVDCIPPAKSETSLMHELRAYKGMGAYNGGPGRSGCDVTGRMTVLPVSWRGALYLYSVLQVPQLKGKKNTMRAILRFRDKSFSQHAWYAKLIDQKSVPWWYRPRPRVRSVASPNLVLPQAPQKSCYLRHSATSDSHRLRAVKWRAKQRVLRSWLVEKIESLSPVSSSLLTAYHALRKKPFVKETLTSTKRPMQESTQLQQQKSYREVETALRWLYRQASVTPSVHGGKLTIHKQDLFYSFSNVKAICWATKPPQAAALAPILQQYEFALSYLLMPAEQPGHISEEEFVALGLIVAELEPELRQINKLLATKSLSSCNTPRLAFESTSKSQAMNTEVSQAKGHEHIVIRQTGVPGYCCVCRQIRTSVLKRPTMPWNSENFWMGWWQDARTRQQASAKAINLLEQTPRSEVKHNWVLDGDMALQERCFIVSTFLSATVSSVVTSNRSYLDHWKSEFGCAPQIKHKNSPVRIALLARAHRGEDRLLAHVNIPNVLLSYPPPTLLGLKLSPGLGRRPALVIRLKSDYAGNTTSHLCILRAKHLIPSYFDDIAHKPIAQLKNNKLTLLEGVISRVTPIDMYCIIYAQNREVGRTSMKRNTPNPVWADEDSADGPWAYLGHNYSEMDVRSVSSSNHIRKCPSYAGSDDLAVAESERLKMTREECQMRIVIGIIWKSVEHNIMMRQEKARGSFQEFIAELNGCNVIPFLARLKWTETIASGLNRPVGHIVKDKTTNCSLLLRFLRLQHIADAQYIMSTAEALRELHSPGVVKIRFLCSQEVSSFNLHGTCSQVCLLVAIVTSHARTSVAQAINQWSDPQMLQAWGHQAVCALANLHQNGLIHQNIHPGAICIDGEGRVVLDDFLFMLDARERHCGYSHGRSDYGMVSKDLMAPEILESYHAVSPKADIWAFGCCLYQWLTGALPSVHSEPLPSILQKIPRRFIGPMYSAISLALQPCPSARADANDLVRILSANL